MERREFLDSLKEGDRVCVQSYQFGDEYQSIAIINYITPKRMFNVGKNRILYNQKGEYNRNKIVELTPEIELLIRNKNRERYLTKIDWRQVPQEKINKIYDVLKEIVK